MRISPDDRTATVMLSLGRARMVILESWRSVAVMVPLTA